jgi:hypothetical protein
MPKATQPHDTLLAKHCVAILSALDGDCDLVRATIETARLDFPWLSFHNAIQFVTGQRFIVQQERLTCTVERHRYAAMWVVACEFAKQNGLGGAVADAREIR